MCMIFIRYAGEQYYYDDSKSLGKIITILLLLLYAAVYRGVKSRKQMHLAGIRHPMQSFN